MLRALFTIVILQSSKLCSEVGIVGVVCDYQSFPEGRTSAWGGLKAAACNSWVYMNLSDCGVQILALPLTNCVTVGQFSTPRVPFPHLQNKHDENKSISL